MGKWNIVQLQFWLSACSTGKASSYRFHPAAIGQWEEGWAFRFSSEQNINLKFTNTFPKFE
ncbi:MAG: hypothetical protein H7178_11185 [Chitinophagaceae bacterium]|nr:hypothetical protein [Chitinophagaceae bacterium]